MVLHRQIVLPIKTATKKIYCSHKERNKINDVLSRDNVKENGQIVTCPELQCLFADSVAILLDIDVFTRRNVCTGVCNTEEPIHLTPSIVNDHFLFTNIG